MRTSSYQRDSRRWLGHGALAWALAGKQLWPHLRLGLERDGTGKYIHIYLHDQSYAYDALGVHSLPERASLLPGRPRVVEHRQQLSLPEIQARLRITKPPSLTAAKKWIRSRWSTESIVYGDFDQRFAFDKCLLLARALQKELPGDILAARVSEQARERPGFLPHFALLLPDDRAVDIYGIFPYGQWLGMIDDTYGLAEAPIADAIIVSEQQAEEYLQNEMNRHSRRDTQLAAEHARALGSLALL